MDKAQELLNEVGDNFIAFGTLLKNPKTSLSDLVIAAEKCGLNFQFKISAYGDSADMATEEQENG